MASLKRIVRLADFLIQQRRGLDVPEHPHFEPESTPYFLDRLAEAREYLEYGSGGSTVEAARQRKKFTTVESDPYFLRAVQQRIGRTDGNLIHVNIGLTGEWGYPVFKQKTSARLLRWAKYASAPWGTNIDPDLILIDGRFRVHCALYSINQLNGRDFELLFDDYVDRPFYGAIEQFARLKHFRGRMAIFGPKEFDQADMDAAIERYAADWR